MQNTMPSVAPEILTGRFIASLGTQSEDGSMHLTAVWFLFEGGCLYGLVAVCTAEVITGESSKEINSRIHRRYMSQAGLADPRAGGTLAAMDDVTLKLTPTGWYTWDMRVLDEALFGGTMKTPGYLLPFD